MDTEQAGQDPTHTPTAIAAPTDSDEAAKPSTETGAAAGAAAATTAEEPEAQPRSLTDWVLACEPGRRRCPNLHLAALGYQCSTWDDSRCCLTGIGKRCRPVNSLQDDGVPEGWLGREMVQPAAATARAAELGAAASRRPARWQ